MNNLNNQPLVSVIIACYNAEPFIDLCMESLVSQTYNNLEILVCDDASNDGSYEKLLHWSKRDDRIKVFRNEENMFAAAARNKCIENSHGDYLMIQDADDISKTNRVEVLLKAFKDNPGISIVSSYMEVFNDDPSKPIFVTNNRKTSIFSKKNLIWGMPFSHPASMITRECVLSVGGYRVVPETRRCQDYDMFMRMYGKGYKAMRIPEALYLYRLDEANYRRRTFQARKGEYKIRLRGYHEMGLMPWAYPFALKPFVSHIVQAIKNLFRE